MTKKFKTPAQFNAAQNKKRGKKNHPMNLFAKNKLSGHPAYVYNKSGHYYHNIGLTHDSDNDRNIRLDTNPNPHDTQTAYIKPDPEITHVDNFKKKYSGWKFGDSDAKKVESVKQKAPKKDK